MLYLTTILGYFGSIVDSYSSNYDFDPMDMHLLSETKTVKGSGSTFFQALSKGRPKVSETPVLNFQTLLYSTDTEYLKRVLPDFVKKTVFRICYNRVGQKVSICDYWNGEHDDLKSRTI